MYPFLAWFCLGKGPTSSLLFPGLPTCMSYTLGCHWLVLGSSTFLSEALRLCFTLSGGLVMLPPVTSLLLHRGLRRLLLNFQSVFS